MRCKDGSSGGTKSLDLFIEKCGKRSKKGEWWKVLLLLALLVVAIKGLFVTVAAMMECKLKDTGVHGDNDENEDGVNGVMLLSAALIGGDGDGGRLEETVWRRMTVLGRRKDGKGGGKRR